MKPHSIIHFLSNIKASGDCWEWQLGKSRGYGSIWLNSKPQQTHRFAYQLAHGPIPADQCVLHACDNPPCCNPAHLMLGTHKENMRQMAARGRASKIGSPKLTPTQVDEIRTLLSIGGLTQVAIANQYGVCDATICLIKSGRNWRK